MASWKSSKDHVTRRESENLSQILQIGQVGWGQVGRRSTDIGFSNIEATYHQRNDYCFTVLVGAIAGLEWV